MALWWRYQGSKIRLFAAYLVAEAGGWPERVAKTLVPNGGTGARDGGAGGAWARRGRWGPGAGRWCMYGKVFG
jgi:hypothetical protein